MFKYIYSKIFGTHNQRYIKTLLPLVKKINAFEPEMQKLSMEDFPIRIAAYKQEVEAGKSLDAILPEVFALVRECSMRVMGMRHYDVQLIGGITLHQGKIAEMKTGEGKTLVATLAVVLNALSGKGVHVVTVNDYLAKRDAMWMGKLYSALGLSIGIVVHGINDDERQAAYQADITYGTNNEFGFDYLRDNMKFYAKQLVQRPHNFAIVDEVDSILIDEARTPLIISGASDQSTELYTQINLLVQKLKIDVDYAVDEKARTVLLSDTGVATCESMMGIDNLFDPSKITFQHHILQALKAKECYKRDVDYIVSDEGKVVIVDEFTGRLMPGRRFGDGLHQALEAKEKVKVEAENQTLASITFQNYFRMYTKLAGMTGTAETEALEFMQIYRLDVIAIPPNKPMVRKDMPDLIYKTRKEKFEAIIESIKELYATGQPVLVGTISIETSELLSSMLKKVQIPHKVLNAKQHDKEAEIVANAGQINCVTIATNMAGRGTDIVLGEGVIAAGGLHILGTERHESRRIDNQLRGRAGRQGDPGSSRFYLSLEDDLMRLFGSEKLASIMEKLGMEDGEPIEHNMVSKAIENAQKRVESHNFEIRKTLLDYDNVMNQQREVIYTLRRDIMFEEDLQPYLDEFLDDVLGVIYEPFADPKHQPNQDQIEQSIVRLQDVCNITKVMPEIGPENMPSEEETKELVKQILDNMQAEAGSMAKELIRYFLLEELDRCWKEHLREMDSLREGIGLRGYGQRDPKLEYKREGFNMFQDMLLRIREGIFRSLTRVRVQNPEEELAHAATPNANESNSDHKNAKAIGNAKSPVSTTKVGRNEPCPCGSGKKYKNCHGSNQ